MWFAKVPPQRDLDMLPRTLASLPTLPFSRLYEQMGEDMQDWIDIRVQAASAKPQWIADAATYYWNQARRLEGGPAWDRLSGWQESIAHKIGLVRLIDQDIGPELLPNYTEEDQLRLARRLEVEALNELNLFLSYVYRLGYYKMPIYPFRPPTVGKTRHAVRVLSAQ